MKREQPARRSGALFTVQKFFPQVRKVVDAKTPADIEVTISDATPKGIKNHETCAMAVACKRKFHLDGVIISRSTAYLVKGKQARRFKLPPATAKEIVSFDRGGGSRPELIDFPLWAIGRSWGDNKVAQKRIAPRTEPLSLSFATLQPISEPY